MAIFKTKMPSSIERAERLIKLCNLFKDRVAYYNVENQEDQYKYANYLWHLAWETGECDIFYEDSGDNSYYDLVGLKINDHYACIPVPLLSPAHVAEVFKNKYEMVEKYKHSRHGENVNEPDIAWEKLMPELVFLSLSYKRTEDVYISTAPDWLPQNPIQYNTRGCKYIPFRCEEYLQWFEYQGWIFKSFKSFNVFFNSLT